MRFMYNLLLLISAPLWGSYVVARIVAGSWRDRWRERFGFIPVPPPSNKPRVWIHCVSVGETLAAQPVVKLLRQRLPHYELVFSTTTPTGQQTAQSALRDSVDYLIYFPLDVPFAVRRALARIQPHLLVLFETESVAELDSRAEASGRACGDRERAHQRPHGTPRTKVARLVCPYAAPSGLYLCAVAYGCRALYHLRRVARAN